MAEITNFGINYVILHGFCLFILLLIALVTMIEMKKEDLSLNRAIYWVYWSLIVLLGSDIVWACVQLKEYESGIAISNVSNALWFVAFTAVGYFWFRFCAVGGRNSFMNSKWLNVLLAIIAGVMAIVSATSPWTGLIFRIDENNTYIRGPLQLALSVAIVAFICAGSLRAVLRVRRESSQEEKIRDYSMGLFAIPIVLCSSVQRFTDIGIMCIGVVLSVGILFVTYIRRLSIRKSFEKESEAEKANIVKEEAAKKAELIDAIINLTEYYEALWWYDFATDESGIYRLRQIYNDESRDRIGSLPFEENTALFAQRYVYKDDAERYIEEMEQENIFAEIEKNGTYSTQFRLIDDGEGEGEWFEIRATHFSDAPDKSKRLLFGLRSIDEMIKSELDRQSMHATQQFHVVLDSISKDYTFLSVIDTDSNMENIIRSDEWYSREVHGWNEINYFDRRIELMNEMLIHPEDRDFFKVSMAKDNVIANLKRNSAYYVDCRCLVNDIVSYMQVKFVLTDVNPPRVVVCFRNMDEEYRERREKEKLIEDAAKQEAFINLFIESYLAAFYVDETDCSYAYYAPKGVPQRHNVTGNFETDMDSYIDEDIVEADRELIRKYSRIASLKERLKTTSQFSYVFRDIVEGYPRYIKMNVLRGHDDKHIAIGLLDVNEEYASEKDENEKLAKLVNARTAELEEKNKALNKMSDNVIDLMGDLVENRDSNSGEHIRRVKGFTYLLGRQVMNDLPEYGFDERRLHLMTLASSLHDLGKIAISDLILLKPGKLTAEEFDVMKSHSIKGSEIIARMTGCWSEDLLDMASKIAKHHHEKWDGKGYPDGLKGDEIPIEAQIVSLADIYDALTTKRCYKDAYPYEAAYQMILNGECGAFSEKLIDCLRRVKCNFEAFASNPDVLKDVEVISDNRLYTQSAIKQKIIRDCVNIINSVRDVNLSIQKLLELIGDYYGADRACLFEIDDIHQIIHNTFEWCAYGSDAHMDRFKSYPLNNVRSWLDELSERGEIFCRSIEDMKDDAVMYDMLSGDNVSDLIAVPLYENGSVVHFVELDDPAKNTEDMSIVRTISQFIHGQLLRRDKIAERFSEMTVSNGLFEQAILSEAYSYFKANLTHDRMVPPIVERVEGVPVDYTNKFGDALPSYSEIIRVGAKTYVDDVYKESYVRNLSAASLIDQYKHGNTMPEFVCKIYSTNLGWHYRRYVAYLSENDKTGDVVAMIVAYDITEEKRHIPTEGAELSGEDNIALAAKSRKVKSGAKKTESEASDEAADTKKATAQGSGWSNASDGIVDNMPGGFFTYTFGDDEKLIDCNDELVNIFGCGSKKEFLEYVKGSFKGMVHPSDLDATEQEIAVQIESNAGRFDHVRYRIVRKDGRIRWIDDYGRLVSDETLGDIFYVFCQDITDSVYVSNAERDIENKKTIEKQKKLIESRDAELESAQNAKLSFFSNFSRDIRRPLEAMMRYTEQAKNNVDNADLAEEYIVKATAAGGMLDRLIDEMIDISVLESGKVTIKTEPIDIIHLSNEILSICRQNARAKKIDISFINIDVMDTNVYADAFHIQQVLLNIISNAINFSESGGKVCYTVREESLGRNGYSRYIFTVEDNGIGMDKEYVSHIFEPFSREAGDSADTTGGAGLGLTIVNRLVDAMGGSIRIDSKKGSGTTVAVSLELEVVQE